MTVWLLHDCYCLLKTVFFLHDALTDLLILLLTELKLSKMPLNYSTSNDNNFGMLDKTDSETSWHTNLEIWRLYNDIVHVHMVNA